MMTSQRLGFPRFLVSLLLFGVLYGGLPLETAAQAPNRIRDYTDADIYLKGVFGPECMMDEYGNLRINGQEFGGGHVVFRLSDVRIRMEEIKEGTACPSPCRQRVILRFDCRKQACITNYQAGGSIPWPATMTSYKLEFEDLRKGRKMFSVFLEMQRFVRQSNLAPNP